MMYAEADVRMGEGGVSQMRTRGSHRPILCCIVINNLPHHWYYMSKLLAPLKLWSYNNIGTITIHPYVLMAIFKVNQFGDN